MSKRKVHNQANPLRKCIVSGLSFKKNQLIRFVVSPCEAIVPDVNNKLPGRGIWVQAKLSVLEAAVKGKFFQKATNSNVSVEKNLIETICEQIKASLCSQISLARKAGKTVFGANNVKISIRKENFGLLIQASDGSPKEAKRISQTINQEQIINCLRGEEIGAIFSREKVVHCVIISSAFVENIIFHANLLNNLKNPLPHYNRN